MGDIRRDVIPVTKSLDQKSRGSDTVSGPKNASSIRKIQMPDHLMQILNEHYSRWQHAPGFQRTWHICGGERPIRDTSLKNRNWLFARRAGLPKLRIHDFRHFHVSLLANAGVNIQEVARRLGHSDVDMTWNTYSHLYPETQDHATQILNSLAEADQKPT